MKKFAIAILLLATTSPVLAQQPAKTVLEFDAQQLQYLGSAIQELPKKIADPFLADLQRQIGEQQKKIAETDKAKADAAKKDQPQK